MKHKLYCFDFDGTLTTKDSMIELIRYAHGTKGLILGLLANIWYLVMMKLHLYPNWRSKERILAHFFGGMSAEAFDVLCNNFAALHHTDIRPQAIAEINDIIAQGGKVIVVSASAENWVAPMLAKAFNSMPTLSGTHLEVKDGKITGIIEGRNCYGEEKVNRIKEYMQANDIERADYYIYAYGDSQGDKQMMEYADESFYKPFRQ